MGDAQSEVPGEFCSADSPQYYREDIIKVQHHCTTTERWRLKAQAGKFYLIMHEHLFVFRKPAAGEDLARLRYSRSIYDL